MKSKTNVLIALRNILKHNSTRLTPIFESTGSANKVGDNLEFFVKDMFCWDALQYTYVDQKEKEYEKVFSWTGDSKHFPDLIIKGGAGVESKKVNNNSYGTIPLNSSYPKDYITRTTQNYPEKSLDKEPNDDWNRKSVIYAIGNLDTKNQENRLISLWLVYGNTIVPNSDFYKKIIESIRTSIKKASSGKKLTDSNELARVTGVDRLGRTNMRVRGMYELKHPAKIFKDYIADIPVIDNKSKIYVVILNSELVNIINDMGNEWENLSKELDQYKKNGLLFEKKIELPDPNKPDNKLPATIFVAYTN